MSCVSRHQGRTAWCLPARDCGSGDGGDCGQNMRGKLFVKDMVDGAINPPRKSLGNLCIARDPLRPADARLLLALGCRRIARLLCRGGHDFVGSILLHEAPKGIQSRLVQ